MINCNIYNNIHHPCNVRSQEHKYGMFLKSFVFSIRLGIKPVAVAPAESGGGANGNRLAPT